HSSYRYFSRYSSLIESPTPRICVRSLHDALPILHGGHVVGHAGDELTAAPAGVKVQGQLEQLVVDPRPEVGNHPLADEVPGVGLRVDDEALAHPKENSPGGHAGQEPGPQGLQEPVVDTP